MEEVGFVKSVEGPFAKVSVQKKSICEKCTVGICHLTDEDAEIEALNGVNAEVGQKVRVVIKPYSYLKGSLMVYGLPALALIAGAIIGKELSGNFAGRDPDLVSAVFAFGMFALSFLFVKLWSVKAEKNTQYKPIIEEIIDKRSKGGI